MDFEPFVVSLIQLSTPTHNCVFDMFKFEQYKESWSQLFDSIFKSWSIKKIGNSLITCKFSYFLIKLGFGYNSDRGFFRLSFPGLMCFDEWNNFIELQALASEKFNLCELNSKPSKISLAKVCELCFSAKLDKRETITNWVRRPLRKSQIEYAALDSEVLIKLYDILSVN